jgi:16S rRNA (guanine527-N7)-methyltransferase
LFERSGLRLSDVQVQQFWTFHQLLRRRNAELDLTRLHSFDTIVLKHYVDCALVATLVDLPSPLLDLGTGAGFPGIPLKIVRPDVHLLLAEPRGKRATFLEEAVRALGLRGVEVVAHRVGSEFKHPVRGVITRAVESIPATLARVAPWLEPGALLLFMKGPGVDAEIDTARRDWAAAFRVVRDAHYSIPETPHTRRLVIVERLAGEVPARAAPDDLDEALAELDALESFEGGAGEFVVDEVAAGPMDENEGDAEVTGDEGDFGSESAAESDLGMAAAHPAPGSGGREIRDILSATNPTLKLLRAVLSGRGVRKHQRAILAGARPILEVVRDFPERSLAWITPGTTPAPPGGAPESLAWYRMSPALFREVDVSGTGGPLLMVDAPLLEAWDDSTWPEGCTLFVPFQDPENVGAAVRTAAGFGVAQVVLLREAANPFHPRSVRAAGSALLRAPLRRGPSIHEFEPQGAPVFALSPIGQDVAGCRFPARFGLLVGLEGPGLPERWRSGSTLAVPMAPGTESLNAAAASAVVLYLWSRQRDTSGSQEA